MALHLAGSVLSNGLRQMTLNTKLHVVLVKDSRLKIQAMMKYSGKGPFMNVSLCFCLQMAELGESALVKQNLLVWLTEVLQKKGTGSHQHGIGLDARALLSS